MYIFTISELLLFHLQIKYSMTTYIVVWHLDLDRKFFFNLFVFCVQNYNFQTAFCFSPGYLCLIFKFANDLKNISVGGGRKKANTFTALSLLFRRFFSLPVLIFCTFCFFRHVKN